MLAVLFGLTARVDSVDPTFDVAAVGDVMLGRYVGREIERTGFASVLGAAGPDLRKAAFAFGNLECVLSDAPLTEVKPIRLRARPTLARDLSWAGFRVLSVANNHALDAGAKGLADTCSALEGAKIRAAGRVSPVFCSVGGGLRIGFLAYCDFPGEAGISYTDERTLASDIRAVRRKADVVVVAWHWGNELSPRVTRRQRRLAELAAAAGADLVLGSHPHVPQPIVWLPSRAGRRCLVAYSLGNFLFDGRTPAEREAVVLHATISHHGVVAYHLSRFRMAHLRLIASPTGKAASALPAKASRKGAERR